MWYLLDVSGQYFKVMKELYFKLETNTGNTQEAEAPQKPFPSGEILFKHLQTAPLVSLTDRFLDVCLIYIYVTFKARNKGENDSYYEATATAKLFISFIIIAMHLKEHLLTV